VDAQITRKGRKIYEYVIANNFLLALVIALVIIVGGVFLGYVNNKVVPVNTSSVAHYSAEPNNKLSFMADWDAPDYLTIASSGYTSAAQTNFFPLFPLLIHIVNYVISSPLTSALLISWCSLVGAIYFYAKVIKKLFNVTANIEALRGVVFFILFPSAVFLIAPYTEALFALLSLGAIYFALKNRYLPAAFLALLATATHITGAFVVVLVAMILYEQKERLRNIILSMVIGSLGLIGYMAFLINKFNNPLEFITAQQTHGWLVKTAHAHYYGIGWLNVVFVILIILAAFYWWKRRRSLAIYVLLFLLIPIIGGQFGGFNRYVLMAFPVQLMVYGKFRERKTAYTAILCLSVVLWAYFLFQYAGGYVGG
jgi:Gpi18-like mannosyltransferase